MQRRLLIPVLILLLGLLGAAAAWGEISQKGNLRITFDGGFAPHSLPRDRLAPVTLSVGGSISTTDDSHPPPLNKLEVALNRNGRVSTRGLPVCTGPLLQSTTTESALARCRPALVGRGSFKAEVESSQSGILATGAMLAFNGSVHGKPALLLHLYTTVPVRVTFVLPLLISHRATGRFGTVLSAKVPILAGGLAGLLGSRRFGRRSAGLAVGARVNVGSSLKFALVAAGDADLYPRAGPTMEWDTAAGHAVLLAAGGRVFGEEGAPLRYGKPGFRNGGFVACGPFDAPPLRPSV